MELNQRNNYRPLLLDSLFFFNKLHNHILNHTSSRNQSWPRTSSLLLPQYPSSQSPYQAQHQAYVLPSRGDVHYLHVVIRLSSHSSNLFCLPDQQPSTSYSGTKKPQHHLTFPLKAPQHGDVNDKVSLNGSLLTPTSSFFGSRRHFNYKHHFIFSYADPVQAMINGAGVDASVDDFEISCNEVLMERG